METKKKKRNKKNTPAKVEPKKKKRKYTISSDSDVSISDFSEESISSESNLEERHKKKVESFITTKRDKWTVAENQAVQKYFSSFIQEGVIPRHKDIHAVKKYFKSRSYSQIKSKVQYLIKSKKK